MTPIERLGIEIVDAGITWTDGMRAAWERAQTVETQCRELLNRAANELGMSPHPEARALYEKIDDALMDMFYEDGEPDTDGVVPNAEVTGAPHHETNKE